jgi:predicted methyltransferase
MRKILLPIALVLSACASSPHEPAAAPSSNATPTSAAAPAPATAATSNATATPAAKVEASPAIKAAVEGADRSPADKALDAGRHPEETLAFFGIAPGMKVADIAAGGGYTTELLARTVGANGTVYGQNSKWMLEKFAQKPWSERLAKPVMKNVKRADRDFDDPLPPDAKDLDAVINVLFYHDTFWMKVDRDKMNKAIFAALKPGGVYGIVDHSGRTGSGSSEVQSLHRIEEKVVIDEVTKAGFKLAAEADFLRNPDDKRDWNDAPGAAGERRGKSDRFVLKFVKP